MLAGQQHSITTNQHEASLIQAREIRQLARSGSFNGSTSGFASGLAQGNIVILPKAWADDFLVFCQRNPVACPLLAVSAPGEPLLDALGHDIDIRTDVPEYHVFRHGKLTEKIQDIRQLWWDDMVTFVLGCSFSFEDALMRAGISLRNIDCQSNVSMYRTNIPVESSEHFGGTMVVSMRPFKPADAIRAVQITTRYPKSHGAPVHLGHPSMIGIEDITTPDFGDAVPIHDDEIPVFWACGVTPQVAIANAKPPIAITHAPGKMLVTDIASEQLSVL
ncbi:putative hydro-lyase [Enterovibrio sp. ZSDZ35]|uniref:Putative hydro-lyase LRP49_07070 n=1 Tax=Enterovibrio qingdaonensis TaxID=2899818 RepID=A0ABT5QIZ4_9GAMM|nr:putative hydro-lyase [Enterovibrio sp. ZSDZ35]MDD1780962.1 putative hydro-lyase [Enterovibrio sp. ZSDZ35]